MEKQELIREAIAARKRSYSPYSHFQVGAALLGRSGKVYTGCNIENAAYTPTNCAERTAFFKAISEGEKEFEMIAIVGGPAKSARTDYCPPCGVCRQVLREFAPNIEIICLNGAGEERTFTLEELLPHSFGPEYLQ